MLNIFENLFHRANRCPFACFLKVLLSVSFIFVLYLAISHQGNVSPYIFIMLVALVGVIAAMAVATHWSFRIRNMENEVKLTH